MILYPAIDIRGGHAVRLIEGDYQQETVFDRDPIDPARRWTDGGAAWIHIVDLDGARDGIRQNGPIIQRIREAVSCKIQVGGGIRTMADVHDLLSLGADRVVIGSAAVTNPELVRDAITAYPGQIAVGLDARDGMVATQGWREQTNVKAVDLAKQVADMGVTHLVFTDIRRDGKLAGPNLEALDEMIRATSANVIASGGVSSINDLTAIRELGAEGAIVGAALYHGKINLADALRTAEGDA